MKKKIKTHTNEKYLISKDNVKLSHTNLAFLLYPTNNSSLRNARFSGDTLRVTTHRKFALASTTAPEAMDFHAQCIALQINMLSICVDSHGQNWQKNSLWGVAVHSRRERHVRGALMFKPSARLNRVYFLV